MDFINKITDTTVQHIIIIFYEKACHLIREENDHNMKGWQCNRLELVSTAFVDSFAFFSVLMIRPSDQNI